MSAIKQQKNFFKTSLGVISFSIGAGYQENYLDGQIFLSPPNPKTYENNVFGLTIEYRVWGVGVGGAGTSKG